MPRNRVDVAAQLGRMNFSVLSVAAFVAFAFFSLPFSVALSRDSSAAAEQDPLKLLLGSHDFGVISRDSLAPGPSTVVSDYLVLAAERTKRPDILRAFKPYRGGWNITNTHYWAVLLVSSLLLSGFCLLLLFLSQDLLLILACAAAGVCIMLSVLQGLVQTEALHTVKYVVNLSDYTVGTLKNVTQNLSLAKKITVTRFSLPSHVLDEIDKLNVKLNTEAERIQEKTRDSAAQIESVFYALRLAFITVAIVLLILSILGFLAPILCYQHVVHIFVVSGWILMATVFILCGITLIRNNAILDTCVALKEWVDHPNAETALSSILPCVDEQTTNKTLAQSKVVINRIVTVVNTFVNASANTNPSPGQDHYYNQSGPLMPPLCTPMEESQCSPQELSIANASTVWESYVCEVSESGICTTVGRVTPENFAQLVAALNQSYAIEHYTPSLLRFRGCNFVRDTFKSISSDYGHPLEPRRIMNVLFEIFNAVFELFSVAVWLKLWKFYANHPQREQVVMSGRGPSGASRRCIEKRVVSEVCV